MKDFKAHIAFLLFLGFTFPQVANSVHYLIFEHYQNADVANAVQLSSPAYEYHTCDYHLTGLGLLPTQTSGENNHTGKIYTPVHIFYSGDHKLELAYNFQLRGPPQYS